MASSIHQELNMSEPRISAPAYKKIYSPKPKKLYSSAITFSNNSCPFQRSMPLKAVPTKFSSKNINLIPVEEIHRDFLTISQILIDDSDIEAEDEILSILANSTLSTLEDEPDRNERIERVVNPFVKNIMIG